MSFPSTTLPQTNDPKEIQKSILDLLDKINQLSVTLTKGEFVTSSAGGAVSTPAGGGTWWIINAWYENTLTGAVTDGNLFGSQYLTGGTQILAGIGGQYARASILKVA